MKRKYQIWQRNEVIIRCSACRTATSSPLASVALSDRGLGTDGTIGIHNHAIVLINIEVKRSTVGDDARLLFLSWLDCRVPIKDSGEIVALASGHPHWSRSFNEASFA